MSNRRKTASERAEKPTLLNERELAAALDQRRQKQIGNQAAAINRLLVDGTYSTEMQVLHGELAATQARLDESEAQVRRLTELADQLRPSGV